MLERLAFDEGALEDFGDHARVREEAHQIVLERDEEFRAAGVALAGTAAAQLAVDAAGFVALRAEHEEAAELAHALAELDVGAAPRHVRGDRHGAALTGVGDDFGFALVLLRVEDVVRNAFALEQVGKVFGGFDARRADEHRLPLRVRRLDLPHRLGVFFARGLEDHVVLVDADARLVRRNRDDAEAVDVVEFAGFRLRRSRHARELFVHAEIILDRDRRVGLRLLFDFDAFLRLDCLVEPVAPSAAGHDAAGVLVHDQHFAVLDDVLHVLFEERVGAEQLGDAVDRLARDDELVFGGGLERGALFGVEVFPRVDFDELRRQVREHERVRIVRAERVAAELRQVGLAALFVDRVIERLLDFEAALAVEGVHHLRVEGVERLAPMAVLHHAQELPVARRAQLHLEQRHHRVELFLRARLRLFEHLARALDEAVAELRLLFHERGDARLELHEGWLVVVVHGTGNDQRRARLVDENRVDLVHDAVIVVALHLVLLRARHAVVAQVVEAEFRRRAVGDVARVGGAPLVGRHGILNAADREPEIIVKVSHPFGVAPREIVVDRHELAVAPRQRVQVERERRDERLTFARRHFRDLVLVKRDPADELHVEMHHVPRQLVVADDDLAAAEPPRRVLHDRERLRQNLVERLPVFDALHELLSLRLQRVVAQRPVALFELVDPGDDRSALFDELPVAAARENLEDGGNAHGLCLLKI